MVSADGLNAPGRLWCCLLGRKTYAFKGREVAMLAAEQHWEHSRGPDDPYTIPWVWSKEADDGTIEATIHGSPSVYYLVFPVEVEEEDD